MLDQSTTDPLGNVVSGELGVSNEATRWLSSWAVRYRWVAEAFFHLLCVPSTHGLAPSPGVDLPVVARHSSWVVEYELRTVRWLSLMWIGTVAALAGAVLAFVRGWPWPVLALLSPLLLLAGFIFLVKRLSTRRGRSLAVILGEPVDVPATRIVRGDQWKRIERANTSNLVVYPDWREIDGTVTTGFPGYGYVLTTEVVHRVDVTKAEDPDKPLGQMRAYDLIEHLARRLPGRLDGSASPGEGRGGPVVHVPGIEVGRLEVLRKPSDGPVVTRAPQSFVQDAATTPDDSVRVYAVTQVVSHRARLVTTVHISADVGPTGLSLTFVLHLLHPLWPNVADARLVPDAANDRFWQTAREQGTRSIFVHPHHEWRRLHRLVRDAGREARLDLSRRERRRLRQFDDDTYWARGAIRDLTSVGTPLRVEESTDVERQVNDLMHDVFVEIGNFFKILNISRDGLKGKEGETITNITNNIDVTGSRFDGDTTVVGNLDASISVVEGGETPSGNGEGAS